MIKCGKCGRRYDYDKYNGICPSCGRYNRRDSANLESDLHNKYDQDPAHTAKAHERVHEKNYDSYRHTEDRKRESEGDFRSTDKKPKRHRLAGILIGIIIVIFLFVAGLTAGYMSFDDGEESVFAGFFGSLEGSDEVTEFSEEAGYLALDIEYTTIQDGETCVNIYDSLYYFPE